MRILAIYRHYWPDTTPYARILRTMLEHLAETGHEPVAYTAQPGYNDVRGPRQPWRESLGGVDVRRIRLLPERKRWNWLRGINFCYFLLRAVLHAVLFRRYDLVIANSHPPILMGWALRLIRSIRGTPYIYHCQDIHPESAALVGGWRRWGLYRPLRRLDGAVCRHAQHVVVLSRDMADAIALRGESTENVTIINNPPLVSQESRAKSQEPDDSGDCLSTLDSRPSGNPQSPVRFLFAGNLGRFQGLDHLIAAARQIDGNAAFQLIFMGEGTEKPKLIAQAGDLLDRRILFLPHQSVARAAFAMGASDYGVVSLLPNVYRYAFPSKCMTYLSAGCPLLAVVERESELARTIVRHDLGVVAGGRTVDQIAQAFLTAVSQRERWTPGRRQAIAETCEALYGEARMLAAWDRLVPPVGRSPRETAPTETTFQPGEMAALQRAA